MHTLHALHTTKQTRTHIHTHTHTHIDTHTHTSRQHSRTKGQRTLDNTNLHMQEHTQHNNTSRNLCFVSAGASATASTKTVASTSNSEFKKRPSDSLSHGKCSLYTTTCDGDWYTLCELQNYSSEASYSSEATNSNTLNRLQPN